jgi:RNA polymerase sigma-70 factor (ECF subfamily)
MAEVDAELVRRTLAGDQAAFEALVSAHLARAQAVARAVVRDRSTCDDVVQEAFLRAYDRLGQLGDPSTFPSWLTVIVRNEAVTWLRRHARPEQVALERVAEPAQREGAAADPRLDALREAMERLPAAYREILRLKYDANLDYQQIAETLDLSVANVEKRLYRARQALLALMPELGNLPK